MKPLLCLTVGLLVFTNWVSATEVDNLRLVPFPKEIRLQSGQYPLDARLVLEISIPEGETFAAVLNQELKRAGLPSATTRPIISPLPTFRLAAADGALVPPSLPQTNVLESYGLEIRDHEIVCGAKDPAGLFHGLQTLCQLIRANRQGNALPCVAIQDWPSLRWRCFQDDMTRGPSSTLDNLKHEASLGSYLKLNLMTYYMEYQYAFKKHPEIGPTNGSLSSQELSALVAYAKPLHLDILGNQQSFGHFGQILKHPQFKALQETADVVTPVHEETYQLLGDLYSEVCPIVPFPWFNVCCDETDGLGTGPSRELAAKIGVGGVYAQHLRRIHDLLRDKHQKRMMMWGDIILQHPGSLSEIPKDTIMLTWAYDARPNFDDQIVPFARSGYEFFVCPGVSDWNRILPDFGVAITNIRNFVRDGIKHGAIGMLTTDWADDGEAIKAVKWHADAWAAECAWNGSGTSIELFNRRIGAVLFGEAGDDFGQAVQLLGRAHRLPGMGDMFNARFWERDFAPKAASARVQSTASNLLAIVRPARLHLEACQARSEQHVLDAFLFGARRMELIGQRMLDGLEAAQLYQAAGERPDDKLDRVEQLIVKNRDAHEELGRQFAALWRSESRPFALDWTLQRYTNTVNDYNTLLHQVQAARSAVSAGKPLPAPEEIGLALFKPVFRGLSPRAALTTPLAPQTLWAESSATRRLGVVIQAGAADRIDLPVEVDVSLPDNLADKPVRAFLFSTNGANQEVLAQLDRTGKSGKVRLILLLSGALLHGTEATVHVYLGLSQNPTPLLDAVSTSAETADKVWMENDKVRLLLGKEGAHLYRWEIKALANRDLTVPGESDWTGFSDLIPHRQAQYTLECTARGPAMVEYQCSDESGGLKTLRLYGGVSWVEVFLSEPTSIYWDYDNPKNFAKDGPEPGNWLFSNGQHGTVGREADGVPAQIKMPDVFWGVKFNTNKLALGLITPETAAHYVIAPGAGAGGVGIEGSQPVSHLVTLGGTLESPPEEAMNQLQKTLTLKNPVEIRVHALQPRP